MRRDGQFPRLRAAAGSLRSSPSAVAPGHARVGQAHRYRREDVVVERSVQLEYSQLEPRMLDEAGRRYKGAKIIAVLQHFLGVSSFAGLRVLDIGTSAGFIASELARAGGAVVGVDIDVPGVAAAAARHGDEVSFLTAEGEHLPLRDSSAQWTSSCSTRYTSTFSTRTP